MGLGQQVKGLKCHFSFKMIAGEAWSVVSSGLCRQRVYRGAFWAVNRPPRIVKVHTFAPKPRFGLLSILKTLVRMYYTGAHKSWKLRESCSPLRPHSNTCDSSASLFFCGYPNTKPFHSEFLNVRSYSECALGLHCIKICFLLSARQMCCAHGFDVGIIQIWGGWGELVSINNIKPLAAKTPL